MKGCGWILKSIIVYFHIWFSLCRERKHLTEKIETTNNCVEIIYSLCFFFPNFFFICLLVGFIFLDKFENIFPTRHCLNFARRVLLIMARLVFVWRPLLITIFIFLQTNFLIFLVWKKTKLLSFSKCLCRLLSTPALTSWPLANIPFSKAIPVKSKIHCLFFPEQWYWHDITVFRQIKDDAKVSSHG